MANLFPTGSLENSQIIQESKNIEFKGSYAFDFEKGEFIKNPDGTIKMLNEFEAYIQWCQKAMLTDRYVHSAYSSKYGKDIIGSDLDEKAMELEIKRITKETLMVHPMTSNVDNFVFKWSNGEVYYEYEVTTIQNEKSILSSTMKVG